jgi:Ubiquitin carboxyl-terminal hydrolase
MLGICLKRYSVSQQGVTKRLNTLIDIPLEILLPHFISDGSQDDGWGSSFSRFKLSLQSVICHRGASIEAGHYVTLVRPCPNEPDAGPEMADVEPKFRWILFDDLAREKRVKYVDVRKALKDEVPYLVFYQVQPVNEYDDSSGDEVPPSYAEATYSPPSTDTAANSQAALSQKSYPSTTTVIGNSINSSLPATVASTPQVLPVKDSNYPLPPNSDGDSLGPSHPNGSHTPSLTAISQTSSQILGSEGVAAQDTVALHPTTSAPPTVADKPLNIPLTAARPHSLDLPNQAASILRTTGRRSQESEPNVRFSIALTDSTAPSAPSAPITPFDNDTTSEGYVGAKEITTSAATTPGVFVSSFRRSNKDGGSSSADLSGGSSVAGSSSWLRGRAKDKDVPDSADVEKRRHSSRRNWLSVSGSVRARTRRPVSQPPPVDVGSSPSENRKSIMAAGNELFKGLRDAMSRDKLTSEQATGEGLGSVDSKNVDGAVSTGDKDAATATAAATAVSATAPGHHHGETSAKGKEKDKGVGRRKSIRKGKARKEQQSPVRTAESGETPERQCRIM